jgi:predicted nucleic acid-binding Zn ribbon protein
MDNVRSAGDVLRSFFDDTFSLGFFEDMEAAAGLFSSWKAVIEEAGVASAAPHSRVADLKQGTVIIEADHPGWIQILQTRQLQLLNILQRRFSEKPLLEIRKIAFRLAKGPPAPENP